jgi:hypothetical protein
VQEGEAARRARGDLEPPAPRQRLQVSTPCSDINFEFLTPSKSDCRTLRLCLVEKIWVKSYCSTFRCYLVNFVQPWIN